MIIIYSTLYYCQILMQFELFDRLSRNHQVSNFMKIHLVGAVLFHAGWAGRQREREREKERERDRDRRQTDRHDEASSRFSQFCERAKQEVGLWDHRNVCVCVCVCARARVRERACGRVCKHPYLKVWAS
jgi:hypothetical protein